MNYALDNEGVYDGHVGDKSRDLTINATLFVKPQVTSGPCTIQ